ncbi:SUF system NifU family Fe-S cluster assembly protein [Nocardioides sp. MAH-18]|uniref:SUF system NifU family Fe-S cluster assembly protein n=1 Tax=Nocardioides agri TaxID=2682843 RepID=A0A6L6XZ58_9ACTN|nr:MULTISPECIES: SUF system NifU family Fe-S cluster assembly protein [unclassified Nocardioides]MBA2952851.1 SUF system NifU family Fe-S cluster assembly protein [Nocardioides sp. CGMCC 1.13656]MVQ52013.1 SUF system NifU family Fe-S cluster assembly protein [Nocardioides sp. MAH-18]
MSQELDSLYQDIILDHAKRRLNAGLREPFEAEVHHVNPTCGDEVTLRLHLDGDVVRDISYDNQGCSISSASASVMTELLIGKTVAETEPVRDAFLEMMRGKGQVEPDEDVLEDAIAFAGAAKLTARIKCALLSWMAFQDALVRAQEDSDD